MKSLKYIPLVLPLFCFSELFAASGDVCINTTLSSVTFSVATPPVCINTVLATQSFTIARQSPVVFVDPTPTVGPGGGGGNGGGASIFTPPEVPSDTPNPIENPAEKPIFQSAPPAPKPKTPPKVFQAKPLFETESIFAANESHMPIRVTPTYFPATGIADWSDVILSQKKIATYRKNPLVATHLPYWSRILDIALPFEERVKELPKSAQNAPFYVAYDAIGIFAPVSLMPNETKEPKQRQYLDALRRSTIHLVGTGYPEDSRKDPVVVIGHSASLVSEDAGEFAAIFKTLPLATKGDIVSTYTKNTDGSYGESRYRIIEVRENVQPTDMSSLTDYADEETLQLVTCYARGIIGALDARIVVIAQKIK